MIPYCKIEPMTEQDLKAKRKKKSLVIRLNLANQVKDFNPIKYGRDQET